MAAEKEIKTVKLYSDVERIYKQLEQLGYSKTDALKVEDVNKFDEYHYLGTDAVLYSIKELEINSSHKVLDFGSGLGGPARYIVASTNCELLAVELQADLNETALDLTKRCGLDGKLKHVCGDILKLDMEPASFDFLVNWLVILHIEDRKTLFDNCFRLLKPGGKIYTEDFFKLSDYDENFGKILKRDLYIECLPTREEYIQQMEQAGFTDIKFIDMTKEWTQFVDQRVRGFHAGKGICYPKYGCFHNDPPFRRPLVPYPNPPDLIGTTYRLYTRSSTLKSAIIDDHDDDKLLNSGYDGQKRTIIIIHGFVEHGLIPWMNRIRQALLQKEDANVIQVDWHKGAKIPYEKAVANTRMVGSQLFELVKFLNNRTDNTPSSFYFVGFSLGAHISGYVGRRINEAGAIKLGRITALDPASVFFVAEHPDVRLDPTDADFVDVMHTDIDFLGSLTQSGHIDFYPNGGLDQRGCPTGIENGPIDYIICDHMRAPEYYYQSVLAFGTSCPMRAFPCKSMYDFERGYCFKCQSEDCPSMGYGAEVARGKAMGKHYLYTNEKSPFCSLHYHVTFKTGHGWFAGISSPIHITIYGSNGQNSGVIRFKERHVNDGTMESFVAPVSKDLGLLTKIDVRHNGIPIIEKWYLEKVIIKFEGSKIAYTACFNAWLSSAGGVRRLNQGELPC